MKKRMKRLFALTLAVTMLTSSLSLPGVRLDVSAAESESVLESLAEDEAGVENLSVKSAEVPDYYTMFTDSTDRGGWEKTSGNGTLLFHDGAGADGYATFTANGNTLFADPLAAGVQNGYVEAKITNMAAARFVILFRYNGPSDWQGIGFDNGTIRGFGGEGDYYTDSLKSFDFPKGATKKVRMEYHGNQVKLYIDGEYILTHTDDHFIEKEGAIGIRTWGEKTGDTQGTIQVDYIKTGVEKAYHEVGLTPASRDLDYESIKDTEIEIKLSDTENALKEIRRNDTPIEINQDYTITGDQVILKKEFLDKIKDSVETTLTFVFEDGYTTDFKLRVTRPEESFTYTRDFTQGLSDFQMVTGNGSLTLSENLAMMEGNGVFVDQNSISSKNNEVEFTFHPQNDNVNYGVILRYVSPSEYLYIGPSRQNNQHWTAWSVYNQNGTALATIEDQGYVLGERKDPYKVKVRVIENVVTIFVDNEEIFSRPVNGITLNAGKTGFRTNSGNGMKVYGFTQREAAAPGAVTEGIREKSIASAEMTVKMDENFPRVIDYTLKSGESTTGQETALHQVEINNRGYVPQVTSEFTENAAVYHLTVPELGVSFDTVYTVAGNTLEMKIKNVSDGKNPIYTINFPEQSMVSMPDSQPGGQLRVNNYQGETRSSLTSLAAAGGYQETTLAVLSSNKIAAAVSGISYKNRHEIAYKTFDCGDHKSTGLWLNEFEYRGVDGEIMTAEPWAKAAVVEDMNQDGAVDYQDGAIALREYCMAKKGGAKEVTSNWLMIAMNVGSESQYPFLRILDNVKKMSLAMDGFGQNIIIKGYQSEGHDASHPDYANYNRHAGGLDDLNLLLEEAGKYNTKVGVHINNTDVYPEAPQFANLASGLAAWDWYDSSKCIVRENDALDKSEDGLDGRLSQLYDTDTKGQMDLTYVDVFFGTRWPMYKMINNIVSRDVILGTENEDEMVSFSSFNHRLFSDFGGGGNLVRFVDNNQADIFRNNQLFRGVSDRNTNAQAGINGWQGCVNMNTALDVFYTKVLPNKYLANFPVMQYTTDNKAVLGNSNEVVTEMSGGVNVISKDGHRIAEGNKIFIPWDPAQENKIYHYNQNGGSSTWDLPNSWADVTSVKLYELSDKGKGALVELPVTSHQVTIQAKARTGYVLYRGNENVSGITADTMDWSTGSLVKDMGFDSHSFRYWKKDASAEHITIENNTLGNSHLYISGKKEGQVTQEITGLIPGQSYSASVWAITSEGRKASIKVDNSGQILENAMNRSNVMYGYHHNDKYQTYAQRMSVKFIAKGTTAKLTLAAETCGDSGSKVDFDDVRVMACGITDAGSHTYFEDFENVDQALGIFTTTESDQSHLSQKNPVNPELTPDVISGTYSLKVRAGDYMRTIPSTVRFAPNTTYTVGLDYKSPTANSFKFGIKSDKAKDAGDTANAVLAEKTAELGGNTKGSITVKFTTGNYDDYYMDLTKNAATEYYVDNVYVDEAKPMNKETLTRLVENARAMEESEYTPDSYKPVQDAVIYAETILGNPDAVRDEIAGAYERLQDAMNQAVRYAGEEDKAALRTSIEKMKALQADDYIQDAKWLTMQAAIEEAGQMAEDPKTTVLGVLEMLSRLEQAKDALTPKVDRAEIKAVLYRANLVERNTVVDGVDLQTFLSALSEAEEMNQKPGVTETEIHTAADKLKQAYEKIILKNESKNEMVQKALEKTEVQEQYFQEADLKAIKEAKTRFTDLYAGKNILIKDYFDAWLMLDGALANKQEKPVLSDTKEIDSSGFELECDNQNPLTSGGTEGPISLAFDKNPNTIWHTQYSPTLKALPAAIVINLKKYYSISQFSYLSRAAGGENGKVQKYDLFYGTEAGKWTKLVADGTFKNDASVEKVKFDPVTAQYLKFVVKQGAGGFGSAAELAVYQKTADMNALQNAVSAFEKLDKNLYVSSKVQALETLIAEAVDMLEKMEASQESVNILLDKIQTATRNLELLPTKTDLKALSNSIVEAKKINIKEYQDTKAFEAAKRAAEEELKSPTTQKAVNEKTVALVETQKALVKSASDKTALKTAIENYKKLNQGLYTKSSLNVLKELIAQAEIMVLDHKATQAEVDGLVLRIQKANNSLQLCPTEWDLKALAAAITSARAIRLSDYLDVKKFTEALVAAQAEQKTPTTQKAVRDKTQALILAQKALVKIPSDDTLVKKELLRREINEVQSKIKKGQGHYTSASWKGLVKALSAANQVYRDSKSTSGSYLKAAVGLKKAEESLKTYAVPKKNTSRMVGSLKYKVTKSSASKGTVTVTAPKSKKYTSITIPATVKIDSYTFRVTAIYKKAFYKNSRLKSVSIGKYVTQTGEYAFQGDKKLKSIRIDSKSLKTVGKNTFKQIHAKAVIKVPSSRLNAYKKLLKKKGQASTVRIVK